MKKRDSDSYEKGCHRLYARWIGLVSMGLRFLETTLMSGFLIVGCAIPKPVEIPLELPKQVTSDNAEWTVEECLRRVTRCTSNGGIVYRPMRLGDMNAPIAGLWKQTAHEGLGGPWVRIPFARIERVEVTPSARQGSPWLITLYGNFSFGFGEFAYGGLSDPVTLFCDAGDTSRTLKEALNILRDRSH